VGLQEEVGAEVPNVQAAFRRGVPPSQFVGALQRRGWGTSQLILLGRRAFELTFPECKGADGWSSRGIDAAAFDGYFVPLIERNRRVWDR
jgi:hypothetical protein